MAAEPEEFSGLAMHDQLPFAWEPSPLNDVAELDHVNQETARALQALAVFEEAPRELSADAAHTGQELLHLEAKVDVLLSLVGMLAAERRGHSPRHSLILRAGSLEWAGPAADSAHTGDQGYAVFYPNPMLPLALRIASRVVGSIERAGHRWLMTRFEHIAPPVESGLEKLIFRRHRRQIALAKGTGVISDTGLFQVPK